MKRIELPQGKLEWPDMENQGVALVVAGGRKPGSNWLQLVTEGLNIKDIYAADKGLDYCKAAGLTPTFACGDGDSASKENWLEALKTLPMETYPVEKDETDLQLLLKALPQDRLLVVTGIWGGRFDHLYSAIKTLTYFVKKTGQVLVLADERELAVMAPQGCTVEFYPYEEEEPAVVSLIPLLENNRVSISGVRWPLTEAVLTETNPYAISNRMSKQQVEHPKVKFTCHEGVVALYIAG